MYQRLCNPLEDKSFLLLGARATGKTWLLEERFRAKALLWINLLENREFLRYFQKSNLLREELTLSLENKHTSNHWVIIDEIQKLPSLLDEVQALLEDKNFRGKVKFALSGSSARKLKRGGANLLAGRALLPLSVIRVCRM